MTDAFQTIPEGDLYWAVLTPAAMPRGARTGVQIVKGAEDLDELFAEYLPVGIDTVKAAYTPLDGTGGRVLAAAAPRERLAAAAGADITVVSPAAVPDAVIGSAGPTGAELAAGLNFLWGDLEAKPVLKAKRRAATIAAGVIVLAMAATVVGLERRAAELLSAAAVHRERASGLLTELYHKPTAEAGLAALDQDLSRLTRTRAPRLGAGTDAADALQTLLSAWPRPSRPAGYTHKLRTETLTATPDNLTLVVALEDRSQVAPLSDSLRSMPGWKLTQPTFTAAPPTPASPSAAGSGAGAVAGAGGGTLNLRLALDPPPLTPPVPRAGGNR